MLRAVRDALPALSAPGGAPIAGVSTRFLAVIDWSLALAPEDRPQSVQTIRQALEGRVVVPVPSARQCIERPVQKHELVVECGSVVDAVFDTAAAEEGRSDRHRTHRQAPRPHPGAAADA